MGRRRLYLVHNAPAEDVQQPGALGQLSQAVDESAAPGAVSFSGPEADLGEETGHPGRHRHKVDDGQGLLAGVLGVAHPAQRQPGWLRVTCKLAAAVHACLALSMQLAGGLLPGSDLLHGAIDEGCVMHSGLYLIQPGGLKSLLPSRGSSFCCLVKPSWLTCARKTSASADAPHPPRLT